VDAAAETQHAKSAGGPQIFSPVRIDLGIWTLVVFLLLFFLLKRHAWQPMLQGLQTREKNIHQAFEEAQRAREEADRLRSEFQQQMAKSQERVREVLDEARREAQHTKDDMVAQARLEIQAERDRLRRDITLARDQALKELWDQSARLGTLIAAKAIRRELKPDDHRRLVDEALKELAEANVGWREHLH
jgi:F-type H+-transporting ATPase subunit b